MSYTPVPASPVTILRYTAHLAKRLSANSIPKYLNIIRILHLEVALPDPLKNNWHLHTILKGIARVKGTMPNRKLPITPSILLRIHAILDFTKILDCVFWAICLTAFFAFLRKSNLLPPSAITFDPDRHLCRSDFTLIRDGVQLQIRWSKTIQFAEKLLFVPLPYLPGHPLCPVSAIFKAFNKTRGAPPRGPAFVIPQRGGGWSPFPPLKFITILRSHLSQLGLQSKEYSGHSFQRGAASWALASGLPGEIIKILGDWKSDAYLNYLSLDHNTKLHSIQQFASGLPT